MYALRSVRLPHDGNGNGESTREEYTQVLPRATHLGRVLGTHDAQPKSLGGWYGLRRQYPEGSSHSVAGLKLLLLSISE